ncbi:MAG: tRNA (N6-isopentenyl adenosine(37)-C2)-methylthiotransferase MiaB [Nitrospirota bacterium]
MRSFKILTFGCQMNEHDSEKMAGLLKAEGYHESEGLEDASLILLNTCSIREKAEQKFYSEVGKLRKLKEKNPSLKIAVSGCIAQQEGKSILKRAPFVDVLLGNQNIEKLPALIDEASGRPPASTEFTDGYEHVIIPAERESAVTAFVNIMYGCDNFCSYCVVPFVRGREKSRRPEDIILEIKALVQSGCREVTLLGQNVNSYGKKLDSIEHNAPVRPAHNCDFPALLKMINSIEGLERIRFVTSHPKDLSDSLIGAMAKLSKVCNAIHLPLQSASDSVLARMNRKYDFAGYMDKLNRLKNAVPDLAVSTDVIVGFPGETEDDFQATVQALEDVRYDSIFAFKYSRRPNTAALKLPGHLPEDVKIRRLDKVLEIQNRIMQEKIYARVGLIEEVLVEGPDKSGEPDRLSGKSRQGKIVNFRGPQSLVGKLVRVKITEGKKHSLIGTLI